jgi:hypothetical protein
MGMPIAVEAAVQRQNVIWAAPTYKQTGIGWHEANHAAGGVFEFRRGEMLAVSPTGGSIRYITVDNPDNARGFTADGVIVDEAGYVKPAAWSNVLRPMLSDTNGWAFLFGTPCGHNWFWREWMQAKDDAESESWQTPTLGVRIEDDRLVRAPHPLENPDFSFTEAEHLFQTLSRRVFEQEFLAEFVDDAGGVFRRVLEAATARELRQGIDGRSYAIGVDWGKYNDFTAIVVIDVLSGEMVYMDRFNQIDYAVQLRRLKEIWQRFRRSVIVAEQNAMGDPLIEQLQRDELPVRPFVTTQASKGAVIEELSLAFERSTVKILPDPILIGELQAFEMERLPTGRMRYGAPEGMHDDCVMALAMAWTEARVSSGDWLDSIHVSGRRESYASV